VPVGCANRLGRREARCEAFATAIRDTPDFFKQATRRSSTLMSGDQQTEMCCKGDCGSL